jgi:hypothetical protein
MALRIELNTKGNQQRCVSRSEPVRKMGILNFKRVQEGAGMTLRIEITTKGDFGVKDYR